MEALLAINDAADNGWRFPENLTDYALDSLASMFREAAEEIMESAIADEDGDRWPDHDVVDEYLRHIDRDADFARSVVPDRLFLRAFHSDNGKAVRTAHGVIRFATDWLTPNHGDASDVAMDFEEAAAMIEELRQAFASTVQQRVAR